MALSEQRVRATVCRENLHTGEWEPRYTVTLEDHDNVMRKIRTVGDLMQIVRALAEAREIEPEEVEIELSLNGFGQSDWAEITLDAYTPWSKKHPLT